MIDVEVTVVVLQSSTGDINDNKCKVAKGCAIHLDQKTEFPRSAYMRHNIRREFVEHDDVELR